MKRARSHRFSRPERQYAQSPHVQPSHGHADAALGALDRPDDLVAEHARRSVDRDLPVEQVQVGPADPAGLHAQQQLPAGRFRDGSLGQREWPPDAGEDHRPHHAPRATRQRSSTHVTGRMSVAAAAAQSELAGTERRGAEDACMKGAKTNSACRARTTPMPA